MSASRFALLMLVCVWMCVPAPGQTPPEKKPLTAEQQEWLKEADKWYDETAKLRKEGKLEDAIAAAEKMYAANVKAYGKLHDYPIGSLLQIAECREQLEQFAEAKIVRERILELQTKRFGKDDWRVTDARLDVSNVDSLSQLSKDQRQEVHKATQLNSQGLAIYQTQPEKALSLLQEALEICKRVLGENHPTYATSLNNLGFLYKRMGQPAKAEPLYLQAKEIRKKVLGENHPDYATNLNNLAMLYLKIDQPAKAEPLYIQAIAIRKKVLGENHPDYATNLNNLAMLYLEIGQPAKAEPFFIQAKAIRLRVLGENHPDYATSLDNLAELYSDMGQHAKAEPLYIQANEIYKKILGENHPNYAMSLGNLAALYSRMDQIAKAEPLYIQAKAIRLKVLGENHPDYATSLNNLALFYIDMGQPTKAEALLLQAKAIYFKVLGENHRDYATSLCNLAALYSRMDQPAKAEPLHLQAKAIFLKVLGENHPSYAKSLNNLALFYSYMGQPAKAEPLYLQAVSIVSDNLERTSEIQTEAAQLETAKANRFYWHNLLQGTAKSASSTVYDPIFRIRGAVTARQMFLRTVRVAKPEVKPLVEELQQVARELSRLVNNPPDPKLKIDVPKKLDELNARYEQLQRELASKSEAFAAYQKKKKATPADLQKLLPDDAVLVDYVAYKDHLCAFAVSKKAIQRFELGAMKPIAEAIDLFREQLNRGTPLTGKDNDPAVGLRDKIWKPLLPAIGSAKLVLLCPDGPLCRLPFAALPGVDDKKYLIEEVSLVTMPVPQMLFDILAPRPEKKDTPSLLTMGDVDFDGTGTVAVAETPTFKRRRAGGPMNWPALPATREEVIAIGDSFKAAVPTGKLLTLRGKDATETSVRSKLGEYEFVHLATHGFFSPKELTAKRKPKDDGRIGDQPKMATLNPGLMSGIVCAGANKAEDAVLTALDIAELDLSKVELAVLSACETGLGETAGGEGVFGLQRAFQLAGARTTITSLWKVSDAATQKLMTRYYENYFQKNMGTLEALREAQLWMLKEGISRGVVRIDDNETAKPTRSPPFYWAAFSLAGDWR